MKTFNAIFLKPHFLGEDTFLSKLRLFRIWGMSFSVVTYADSKESEPACVSHINKASWDNYELGNDSITLTKDNKPVVSFQEKDLIAFIPQEKDMSGPVFLGVNELFILEDYKQLGLEETFKVTKINHY